MAEVRPIVWKAGRLLLLDQRKLPGREAYLTCEGVRDTARAIRDMVVRGAPAIGVTAAYGMALGAKRFRQGHLRADFDKSADILMDSRPTAVNLRWSVERLSRVLDDLPESSTPAKVHGVFVAEARAIMSEDIDVNRTMGAHGAKLLEGATGVLTHCNAGALATAGFGTALGVIRSAWQAGTRFDVFATETRPYLQGARLTAWELKKLRIPVTLLADGMVGSLFARGLVSAVVVGTDRTAANGDVANKVGTYPIAVLARRHGVDFYVAAPTSSIDLRCSNGDAIPIEERSPEEVTNIGRRRIAAAGVDVFNPAFDVTPAELVTAIITESGVVKGNYRSGLKRAVESAASR